MDFAMGFDPGSLAEIVRFTGFSILLDAEVSAALIAAGGVLTEAAVANTWQVFENPTGALAESIYPWLDSPMQIEIRVGVPYGRRREFGFSGMTDSLGRYYADDPAKPYLQPAIDEHQDEIVALIATAVQHAWAKVGGSNVAASQ